MLSQTEIYKELKQHNEHTVLGERVLDECDMLTSPISTLTEDAILLAKWTLAMMMIMALSNKLDFQNFERIASKMRSLDNNNLDNPDPDIEPITRLDGDLRSEAVK